MKLKLIHLPSVYLLTDLLTPLLTDSIICPHNALKNLAKVEKIILWPNFFKVSGRKSPGQHSLDATTWEFSLEEQQVQQIENHQPFYEWSLCEPGENFLQDEKKGFAQDLSSSSAKLSFSKHTYFHTFNWHLQVLIMQKVSVSGLVLSLRLKLFFGDWCFFTIFLVWWIVR